MCCSRSRCCSGNSMLCCCCCGKRGATIFFALAGLVLAASVIVPPVYVHQTDRNYSKLFPILTYGRAYLEQAADRFGPPLDVLATDATAAAEVTSSRGTTTVATTTTPSSTPTSVGPTETLNNVFESADALEQLQSRGVSVQNEVERSSSSSKSKTYRLAIFQLIDDTEAASEAMAFAWFCMGCLNVPLDLLLLVGACLRQPCGLLPWLVVTLLEHIALGVPFIVFFGLVSLYLAAQLHLYVVATGLIVGVVILFSLSLSSWFTVLSCYKQFCKEDTYRYDTLCQNGGGGSGYPESGHHQGSSHSHHRRSGHHTGEHSLLPPGHPSRCSTNGYRINGGYYPPHQSSRQLPPVPP